MNKRFLSQLSEILCKNRQINRRRLILLGLGLIGSLLIEHLFPHVLFVLLVIELCTLATFLIGYQTITQISTPLGNAEKLIISRHYITFSGYGNVLHVFVPRPLIRKVIIHDDLLFLHLCGGEALHFPADKLSPQEIRQIQAISEQPEAPLFRESGSCVTTAATAVYQRHTNLISGLIWLCYTLFLPGLFYAVTPTPDAALLCVFRIWWIYGSCLFTVCLLFAPAHSLEPEMTELRYFSSSPHRLRFRTENGLYCSVRKDFVRKIYSINNALCIRLKNNIYLPFPDSFYKKELPGKRLHPEHAILLRFIKYAAYLTAVICAQIYLSR